MSQVISMDMVASGLVDGATGNLLGGKGFTPVRAGAGLYDLTLPDGGIDENECVVEASPVAGAAAIGAGRFCTVLHTSDTVKRIAINEITPIDIDTSFHVNIFRLR